MPSHLSGPLGTGSSGQVRPVEVDESKVSISQVTIAVVENGYSVNVERTSCDGHGHYVPTRMYVFTKLVDATEFIRLTIERDG